MIVMVHYVDSKSVLLPPLENKFGIMKKFVKVLFLRKGNVSNTCATDSLNEPKLKEEVLNGSRTRKLMKESEFETKMKKAARHPKT